MFKGPNRDMDAIYTAPTSAVCGVSLQANGKEYLITGESAPRSSPPLATLLPSPLRISPPAAGKLKADGTMHVTLCDFIELWESTTATQKKSLTQRYEMGCDCKVERPTGRRFQTCGAACTH